MKKSRKIFEYKHIFGWLLIWFLIYKFINKSDLIVAIQHVLPTRESGLLMGMVWGEKNGLSKGLYELLINTGLIHIVVVSGANLMIVARSLVETLAKYVGRKSAIIGGGGIVLFYVNLVGWQIPVVRALLFLGIYYLAQILGRRFRADRALFLVVIIMLLADFKVIYDVSFWLSMAAFGAILLCRGEGVIKTTLWVSFFVLHILSINFGTITLITPITNLAVLFLVETISIVGFVGSLVSLGCGFLGKVILSVSYPMLRYLIEVIEFAGKWRAGVLNFRFNWGMLLGWYLLLGGYWYEKKKI